MTLVVVVLIFIVIGILAVLLRNYDWLHRISSAMIGAVLLMVGLVSVVGSQAWMYTLPCIISNCGTIMECSLQYSNYKFGTWAWGGAVIISFLLQSTVSWCLTKRKNQEVREETEETPLLAITVEKTSEYS